MFLFVPVKLIIPLSCIKELIYLFISSDICDSIEQFAVVNKLTLNLGRGLCHVNRAAPGHRYSLPFLLYRETVPGFWSTKGVTFQSRQ